MGLDRVIEGRFMGERVYLLLRLSLGLRGGPLGRVPLRRGRLSSQKTCRLGPDHPLRGHLPPFSWAPRFLPNSLSSLA